MATAGAIRSRPPSRTPRARPAGARPVLPASWRCAPSRTSPTSSSCSRAGPMWRSRSLAGVLRRGCCGCFYRASRCAAAARCSRASHRPATALGRAFSHRRARSCCSLYPVARAGCSPAGRRHQVDRQFRHPDPHLRHAGLGPEHRRRPRRPARSRLRRLLCGRRLHLRALATSVEASWPNGSALWPWAFWICLPLAGLLAAFWGILLGFPVLRLRGDYLAIVTSPSARSSASC